MILKLLSAASVTAFSKLSDFYGGITSSRVTLESTDAVREVLNEDALKLLRDVHQKFGDRVTQLLLGREKTQAAIDGGDLSALKTLPLSELEDGWIKPTFPDNFKHPDGAIITGPADFERGIGYRQGFFKNGVIIDNPKTLEDFEDSKALVPGSEINGQYFLSKYLFQRNLAGTLGSLKSMKGRPSSIHLPNVSVAYTNDAGQEEPGSAFLTDVSLFVSRNLPLLQNQNPRLTLEMYIPKLRNAEEVKMVRDLLSYLMKELNIQNPHAIKVTLMIETFEAATQVGEMIKAMGPDEDDNYGHKDINFISGVNVGRWDWSFDLLKTMHHQSIEFPDRKDMGMGTDQLVALQKRVIAAANILGVHPEGGMSGVVLSKTEDLKGNKYIAAIAEKHRKIGEVLADKLRELLLGFRTAWVAQPDKDLVDVVNAVFGVYKRGGIEKLKEVLKEYSDVIPDELMTEVSYFCENLGDFPFVADSDVDLEKLMAVNNGTKTKGEFFKIIELGYWYFVGFNLGVGAVNLEGNMNDMAVGEIAAHLAHKWISDGATLLDVDKNEIKVDETLWKEALKNARDKLTQRFVKREMRGFEDYGEDDGVRKNVDEKLNNVEKVFREMFETDEMKPFVAEAILPYMVSEEQLGLLQGSKAFDRCAKLAQRLVVD